MNKGKAIATKIKSSENQRRRIMQFRLNDLEYNAIEKYCDIYKINNKARWIRETIIKEILRMYQEDAPTIFQHPDYIDNSENPEQQFLHFDE